MNPREEELVARALLEDPALVNLYWKEKRWAELAALVRFARRDVPVELAQTDPALYRRLREQITRHLLARSFGGQGSGPSSSLSSPPRSHPGRDQGEVSGCRQVARRRKTLRTPVCEVVPLHAICWRGSGREWPGRWA